MRLLFTLLFVVAGCDGSPPPAQPGAADTGVLDDSDGSVVDDVVEDAGADTRADNCECDPGQTCVSNEVVTDQCFDRDCGEVQCDAGMVCYAGACVDSACAGVDCGGYPNVCGAGVCVVGNCDDDPDVRCPDGLDCVEGDCLTPCADTSQCLPLACRDGHCRPCELDVDCGPGFLCRGDQCLPTLDPQTGGLCSGCESMASAAHRGVIVLGPVEGPGGEAQSGRFKMVSGAVFRLEEER